MDIALPFFKEFVNLGAAVMLPVVIFILGLFFRMKPSQALRAGLLVGIGFQGVVLTINFLLSTIQPALDYYTELGSGYEWWKNFYEFHKLAIDELEAFDYETYKKNGFKVEHLGDYPLSLETKDDLRFQLRGDE